MSFWRKLLGHESQQTATGEPTKSGFPYTVDLIPEILRAQIFHHVLQTLERRVPCWSFVSDGLLTHGQAELVMTLAIAPDEQPAKVPAEPLDFFKVVHDLARRGELVHQGDFTAFGGNGLLGFAALAYARYERLEGVQIPSSALQVMALRAPEHEARMQYGLSRVLARLGDAYRHYPWPPWIDRARPTLAATDEDTLLAKVPRFVERGMRVRSQDNTIVLRLLPTVAEKVAERMRACDGAIALLTETDPTADGCLVWVPEQRSPRAITPEGSRGARLAGNFLMLARDPSGNGGRLFEDGFAMVLSDVAWMQVRQAIVERETLLIAPSGDEMGLRIEWQSQRYHNLVDGKTYEATSGWETYLPRQPSDDALSGRAVNLDQVVFLTPESELEARTETKSLARYVSAIADAVTRAFDGGPVEPRAKLIVQFALARDGATHFEFASDGPLFLAELGELRATLLGLEAPPVTGGDVRLNLILGVPGAVRDTRD